VATGRKAVLKLEPKVDRCAKRWPPGPRYPFRRVHWLHDMEIKRRSTCLNVILPQVAAAQRPWDGGALEDLKSICAWADLQSDLVGTFPVDN